MANYANSSLEERIARRKKRQRAVRRQKAIFGALCLLLIVGIVFLGYTMLSGGDEESPKEETKVEEKVTKEEPKKEEPKKETPKAEETPKETVNDPAAYGAVLGINELSNSISEKLPTVIISANDEFAAQTKVSKVDPEKPMVALTFDDGPSAAYSNRILDALEKNGARASFFVLGELIPGNEAILQRAVSLGCEVANHSYDHPLSLTKLSESQIKKQITDTNELIKNATGKDAPFVRTPGGSVNATVKSAVGLPIISWSVDTVDWKSRNTDAIVEIVMNNVQDGDIILMHEIYKTSAAAAEILVPKLIEKGYQLVTVSELMEARGKELKNGTVYFSAYPKK